MPTLLGTRRIDRGQRASTNPFGTIDTPGQGETVSGVDREFRLGAHAAAATIIPIDGSTIDVYVDGVLRGHPVYNNYRADIAALFPGSGQLATGPSAISCWTRRTLTNGLHTISGSSATTPGSRRVSEAGSSACRTDREAMMRCRRGCHGAVRNTVAEELGSPTGTAGQELGGSSCRAARCSGSGRSARAARAEAQVRAPALAADHGADRRDAAAAPR